MQFSLVLFILISLFGKAVKQEDSVYVRIKQECINTVLTDTALVNQIRRFGLTDLDKAIKCIEEFRFSELNKIISHESGLPESTFSKHPYQIRFTDCVGVGSHVMNCQDTIWLNWPDITQPLRFNLKCILIHEYIHSLTLVDAASQNYRNFKWLANEDSSEDSSLFCHRYDIYDLDDLDSWTLPNLPWGYMEGITEWSAVFFYEKLYGKKIEPEPTRRTAVLAAEKLASIVGRKTLIYCFFSGDVDYLEKKLNKKLGKDWWDYLDSLLEEDKEEWKSWRERWGDD